MSRGFDRIANHYDKLARIVFGKSIEKAQTHFLSSIPDSSNVLILGGGTGWILNELRGRTKQCRIWYIDLSERMISLARMNESSPDVIFIQGDERSIPQEVQFDVVITNFFLDLFPYEKLERIIQTILRSIKKHGAWLVSDFVNKKYWHRVLLWKMYWFFRIVTDIEASALPPWEFIMQSYGLREVKSHWYYRGFIKSVVYSF